MDFMWWSWEGPCNLTQHDGKQPLMVTLMKGHCYLLPQHSTITELQPTGCDLSVIKLNLYTERVGVGILVTVFMTTPTIETFASVSRAGVVCLTPAGPAQCACDFVDPPCPNQLCRLYRGNL